MIFESRPDFFKLQRVDFRNKNHTMGVSHGNRRDVPCCSIDFQWMVDEELTFPLFNNNLIFIQSGCPAHVHGGCENLIVFDLHLNAFDAAKGLDVDLFFGGQPPVIDVFCHATDRIAAHFAFRAVRIEHGDISAADDNDVLVFKIRQGAVADATEHIHCGNHPNSFLLWYAHCFVGMGSN